MDLQNKVVVDELIPALIKDDLEKYKKIMEANPLLDIQYYGGANDSINFKNTIYERWVPETATLPMLSVIFNSINIFNHVRQNTKPEEMGVYLHHHFNPLTESLVVENDTFFKFFWEEFQASPHFKNKKGRALILVEVIKKAIVSSPRGPHRVEPVLIPDYFVGSEKLFEGLGHLLIDSFNNRATNCFKFLLKMGAKPYEECEYGHIPYRYIQKSESKNDRDRFLELIFPNRKTKAKKMGNIVL